MSTERWSLQRHGAGPARTATLHRQGPQLRYRGSRWRRRRQEFVLPHLSPADQEGPNKLLKDACTVPCKVANVIAWRSAERAVACGRWGYSALQCRYDATMLQKHVPGSTDSKRSIIRCHPGILF